MHWTTVLPLGLGALSAALAPGEGDGGLQAGRMVALAVALEVLSQSDLHVVSLVVSVQTIVALLLALACESGHLVAGARTSGRPNPAARAQWDAMQRAAAGHKLLELAAARHEAAA